MTSYRSQSCTIAAAVVLLCAEHLQSHDANRLPVDYTSCCLLTQTTTLPIESRTEQIESGFNAISDVMAPKDSNSRTAAVDGNDKLRDGPCQQIYSALQECAIRMQSPATASSLKEQMQSCPSETDLLIQCIHKHPLYFQRSP